MKILLPIIAVMLFSSVSAQIPAGYYDSAQGYTGDSLRIVLNNIIQGHTEFPYSSSGTDVWDILKATDKDTLNSNNVILLYSGWSVNASQEYNSGNGWNREHVWAKSRGNFGTSAGPGTDVHALRPCDISVNSARANRWFATCSEEYIDGSGATGSYFSSTEWLWQPRGEVKGDVARMIFYMATRYEGEGGEPDLQIIDNIPSNNNTLAPIHAKLTDLLQWHLDDPVNDWERNRNDIIYYNYQNNRNPFIDHPEYAMEIWGIYLAIPSIDKESDLLLYPNPANNQVTVIWNQKEDYNIKVMNSAGKVVYEQISTNNSETSMNLEELSKGFYHVVIKSEMEVRTKKLLLE